MTCSHCVNGLRPLEWTDPLEIAVCLCPSGQVYRQATNNGRVVEALWQVWCAVHQVEPGRVYLMEQVWSAEELAAAGLRPAAAPANRAAALLAAGQKGKR
jgi:hypothetical protein